MKLLITGANGTVAKSIRPLLLQEQGMELLLSDLGPVQIEDDRESTAIGNLNDQAFVDSIVGQADGVLHLGGQSLENTFENILDANIRGTYHVFDAARRLGKPRILFASSNHVIGMHSTSDLLTAESEMRPDCMYGLSKCYGELLARLYWEKFGVQSVSVRIGSCFEKPKNARMLATWLSPADMARLVLAVFAAKSTGAGMVYGVSNNTRAWWSNDHVDFLDWTPQDSADEWEAHFPEGTEDSPESRLQGGPFATAGHFEDS